MCCGELFITGYIAEEGGLEAKVLARLVMEKGDLLFCFCSLGSLNIRHFLA